MKKIFQYIIMAVVTILMASCTSDIENTTTTTGKSNVQLVVGEFPVFGDSQTRAIGTPDVGKTAWANGDELLVEMKGSSYGTQHATFTYNGSKWELTSGVLAYKEDEMPTFPHVYYAPNYKWEAGALTLKKDKVAGTDECIDGSASITDNGTKISVSFPDAVRQYSRLRIATNLSGDVTVTVKNFTPANTSSSISSSFTLTPDAKGNAYLYGSFAQNGSTTVTYNGITLASHTFNQATGINTSYALNATAVSLVGMSADNIKDEIKKKLDAGKTDINLILAPDADENTLDAIHYVLQEAEYRSINLTLIGCKKIPSGGFMNWTMLKSIVLPDVAEIEENAFSNCSGLQKVVFGYLTKVYGNVGKNGIFEGCTTKSIDLFLSKDQKVMNGSDIGGKYCWTADNALPYSGCDYHNGREFLDYEFRSITCKYRVP